VINNEIDGPQPPKHESRDKAAWFDDFILECGRCLLMAPLSFVILM